MTLQKLISVQVLMIKSKHQGCQTMGKIKMAQWLARILDNKYFNNSDNKELQDFSTMDSLFIQQIKNKCECLVRQIKAQVTQGEEMTHTDKNRLSIAIKSTIVKLCMQD